MKISEKIRQTRQQRGYSQEAMADSLGLSTTAYGDIERGKTDLTLSRLSQIADVLAVTPLALLGAEAQAETEASQQRLEKKELELEKLRLEATYWKEKYQERIRLEEFGAQLVHQTRERIGFK
ncbi:MAG: helix-turn-helix transcriptional regulator [Sphingobacteriaceae bacterium]|nr:helix-turn-helix transcriptional regulator [Cytophagaceae bacterium]